MNYKIIGGDGREYGPVSLDELKNWVREGRVGRNSLVARSDVGVWLTADKFSELESELRDTYAKNPMLAHSTYDPVGFWARLGAFLLDNIALWVAFYVVWAVVGPLTGAVEPAPPANMQTPEEAVEYFKSLLPFVARQYAVYIPMHFLYYVLLNGTFGATLGKMIIGARIVNLDGSRIGYGRAILRYLCERLSDLICYIGYLFIAFRDDKRGLHDLIASTRVIYKR